MPKTLRYTPDPPASTASLFDSAVLSADAEAWNLAWLSYPCVEDIGGLHDPLFTTHVRRTLQKVLATGELDLIDALPAAAKVHGLLRLPPPAAALRLAEMAWRMDLALYRAYGEAWLECLEQRARAYREPHHPLLDAPVRSTAQALLAICACK